MIRFFKVLLLLLVLTSSQAYTKNKKNRGKGRNNNVQAQPVKQVEPAAPIEEVKPMVISEPLLEAAPVVHVETEVEAERAIQSEADAVVQVPIESAIQIEPIMNAEEVVHIEQVIEAEAFAQPEPAAEPEFIAHVEPVIEAESVAQPVPAAEPKFVAYVEPVIEAESLAQPESAAEQDFVAQVESEEQTQPAAVVEAEIVINDEPALEIQSSLGMQDTGEKPAVFEYFNHPVDSLRIAARYLPDNPVVVEAGAFDGQESCTLAYLWPNGEIHSFEPVSQLYDRVLERTNPVSNISVYKKALGDSCGQQRMYLSNERSTPNIVSMSSSLYPPKEHLLYCPIAFNNSEMVETTTLDRWSLEYGVPQVDMLWLDMQGYELPALKAAPNVLSGVSVILTEVEFIEAYEGQPLYRDVRSWLEEQGFVLVAGNFWFPKNPDQWFGDGLFVRKELLN